VVIQEHETREKKGHALEKAAKPEAEQGVLNSYALSDSSQRT
jgi:hypothetical protein